MNHTSHSKLRCASFSCFLYFDFSGSLFWGSNQIVIATAELSDYSKRNCVAIPFLFMNFQEQAEAMIRRTGDRATSGRVRILAVLLAERRPVTHHQIEERLRDGHRLDRVTLYRVLEWLNEKYFVHKVVSDDRVWRFRANVEANLHRHAHFKCTRCTTVICLNDLKAKYDGPLPAGYRSQEIELTVKGLCAECV